ncbi:hypothetical protein NC651_017977 [Populus alba x Populus x berolinensis]|nr:hypothetical protein NC651_017977 [Populus alba x Populus x berolinensis]
MLVCQNHFPPRAALNPPRLRALAGTVI